MSTVCYKCQKHLPDNWEIKLGAHPPDNSWHMRNVCPDAEHGGIMVPICYKCDPDPLQLISRVLR